MWGLPISISRGRVGCKRAVCRGLRSKPKCSAVLKIDPSEERGRQRGGETPQPPARMHGLQAPSVATSFMFGTSLARTMLFGEPSPSFLAHGGCRREGCRQSCVGRWNKCGGLSNRMDSVDSDVPAANIVRTMVWIKSPRAYGLKPQLGAFGRWWPDDLRDSACWAASQ